MALNTKAILSRIKSVKNTKKITKAMELVAASKMRKAVHNVLASRAYSDLAWKTVIELAAKTENSRHALLEERPIKKIAMLLITSNRGLCGGFNSQIIAEANRYLKEAKKKYPQSKIEVITLGKKGKAINVRYGFNISAAFEKPDLILSTSEISAISYLLINGFTNKEYDKVVLGYTDFVSALKQVPRIKELLPLKPERDEMLGEVGEKEGTDKKESYDFEYLFEPSPAAVLATVLPKLTEIQIYQAVLESDASEHSARMMAMRNATDAANEMIKELTLIYNQTRQAGITAEIAEISSGAAALKK